MTASELIQLAQNAGIEPFYENWRRERVAVPAETLAAILAVLEDRPGGAQRSVPEGGRAPRPGSARPVVPGRRQWGFTVQLYSVRSRYSWGHGDLHDLADLARWSASELGAGFILVNPLHAAEPLAPISPSPYLPMTRMFISPLYLRVEDIPEYDRLDGRHKGRIARLADPLRASNHTDALIDRDAVWTAKREALRLLRSVRLTSERQAAFDKFKAERGRELELWSAWCALAERHGPDWRDWPASIAPVSAGMAAAAEPPLREAAEFHGWLQWHADEQLAAAQHAARTAGMRHGLIGDLAVGVHPGGADAWAHRELLVAGFSVGAPPDGFNQLGQDWGQPPWHPRELAGAGYRPLAELFGAALRHCGGLRVDHVMGLMRLWWVPAGQGPDRGAYVRYDHRASIAALASSAAEAGAVAIGEDLGTVDEWVHSYLADQGILGTTMLWFSTGPDGEPLPPARWRRPCMATVGTHDVPPVSGFVTADQVNVRARLGLLATPLERERAESKRTLARWRAALEREGLLGPGQRADAAHYTVALYGYLRKTPSLLIGVSLADAVGEVRTQNIPGTSDEYPNWRIPLCGAAQRPVLVEDLPNISLVGEVCKVVS